MSFLDKLQNSLSWSTFIGPSPTPDASDAREAGITRPPTSTISSPPPTASTTATVDLTGNSPPRMSERPVSSHADSPLDESRPSQKLRREVSNEDIRRLVPNRQANPAGATPVPDPVTWRLGGFDWQDNMNKPGATHSHRPILPGSNQLNRGLSSSQPKTYSIKGRTPVQTNNFNIFDHYDDLNSMLPIDNSHPSKRLKTMHDFTSVDEEDHPDSPSHAARSSPIHGSHLHSSRQSTGSGHTASARHGPPSTSEFVATEKVVNSRRKNARTRRAQNGHDVSSPIDVDEAPNTSIAAPTNIARLMQLDAFQQGRCPQTMGSEVQLGSKIISSHFLDEEPRINLSSEPVRGGVGYSRRKPQRYNNLHTKFRRSAEDDDPISDDELAPTPPAKAKQQKLPTKCATPAFAPYQKIKGMPPQGWSLQYVKAADYQGRGPDLALKRGNSDKSWRIVAPNEGGVIETKHEFSFAKVNRAEGDNGSRIRLQGPRQANGRRYQLDLQFENKAEFRIFKDTYVAPATATGKVSDKAENDMVTIFKKPFDTQRTRPYSSQSRMLMSGDQVTQPSHILDDLLLQGSRNEPDSGLQGQENLRISNTRGYTRQARTTRASQTNYVEIEDAPRKPQFSIDEGLGIPWKRQLTYGSGRRRTVIDFSDLPRLDEENYLNDSLIDFYMIYLFNHRNVATDQVYFFNTHFFSTLTRKVPGQKGSINYSAVARWTAKEDLFNYDYIIVPINQDFHWYLAIICNVRNIARKPVLDGIEDASTFPPKTSNESGGAQLAISSEEDFARASLVVNAKPAYHAHNVEPSEDEKLIDDDSHLDLVDANALLPVSSQTGIANSGLSNDSADEAIRMKQLSLSESAPTGMLPRASASPVTSRKLKRKSGPPAKKWDTEEPCIIILDSLAGGARSGVVRALKDYIKQEGYTKRGMDVDIKQNAFYAKSHHIPQQENLSDCGVYLLGYTQKFFEDPDDFKNRLLKGKMQADEDWPDLSIPKLRATMRNILQGLHSEQDAELRRVHAEKKANKSVSAAPPTSRADMTSTKTDSLSADTSDATKRQETVAQAPKPIVEVSHVSNDSEPEIEEPKASCGPAPKTRLGSPFEPRKFEEHAPQSPAPAQQLSIETGANSKLSTPSGRPRSSGRVTDRRPSPQVVVRSPVDRRHEKHMPDDDYDSQSSVVEVAKSKKKQKKEHAIEAKTSDAKSPERLRGESLPNGNTSGAIPAMEVHSPNRSRKNHIAGSKATNARELTNGSNSLELSESVKRLKPFPESEITVGPPPKRERRDITEGPMKGPASDLTNGSRASGSSSVGKPRPFSKPTTPREAEGKSPTVKAASNDTRGSSLNPIEINNPYDLSLARTSKQMFASGEALESKTVASPKGLSKQALEAAPGSVRHLFGSHHSRCATPSRRTGGQGGESFGKQLDSELQHAQDTKQTGQAMWADEESWNGCSTDQSTGADEDDC